MNRKKNTIYILLLVVIITALTIFYYINRPVALTQETKKDLIFFSKIKIKSKNDLESFNHLIENVIVLEGRITKIKQNRNMYTLFIYSNIIEEELICSFQLDQNINMRHLKRGDTIKIRGVYKGFLDNMIFQNCILN